MLRMPAPSHVNSRAWSSRNCFLNCARAASISRPPFSWRPKSPCWRLWRSRENASASGPLSFCTPGSKSEREYESIIGNGTSTVRPPTPLIMSVKPQNVVSAQ